MKVHELITRLQNFPMDMDVVCLHEHSDWIWDGDEGSSYEDISCEEAPVARVEAWTYERTPVVRIS